MLLKPATRWRKCWRLQRTKWVATPVLHNSVTNKSKVSISCVITIFGSTVKVDRCRQAGGMDISISNMCILWNIVETRAGNIITDYFTSYTGELACSISANLASGWVISICLKICKYGHIKCTSKMTETKIWWIKTGTFLWTWDGVKPLES